MRMTADNGRGVEVKDGGRGIPLLLVHGFPLSSEMFADMRPLVERVGRVVALDLPGFGSSDARESGYTMDELAGEVIRVADHLGLERFVLGGHSMGGYVALRVAAHHRDRLAGLVLIDTRWADDSSTSAPGSERAGRLTRTSRPGTGGIASWRSTGCSGGGRRCPGPTTSSSEPPPGSTSSTASPTVHARPWRRARPPIDTTLKDL